MADSKTVLVVAPKKMSELFAPQLEKYGYTIKAINDPGTKPENWTKITAPDVLVLGDRTENEDFKWEEFLVVVRKRWKETHCIVAALSPEFAGGLQSGSNLSIDKSKKLGANSVYFYPYEKELVLNDVFEFAPIEIPTAKLDLGAMMKIGLADVESENAFPFDIFLYLSLNEKLLMYRRAGAAIEGKVKVKADDPRFFMLVRRGDYQKYQRQMVEKLKAVRQSEDLTPAQKTVLVREEVRGMVGSLFADEELEHEEAQKVVENFRNVATNYIDSITEKPGAQEKLQALSAQILANHTHSMNCSAYAVMFGMMAGVTEDLEALSLAGMLHDMGFYKLPMNYSYVKEWELEDSEREEYRMHPLYTIDVIVEKKLPVPAKVHNIIQQHHERVDGSGYPHGLEGEAIDPLSQILALADVFDEMTSLEEGRQSKTPQEALHAIAGMGDDPAHPVYNEEVHAPIIKGLLEGDPTVDVTSAMEASQKAAEEAAARAAENGKVEEQEEAASAASVDVEGSSDDGKGAVNDEGGVEIAEVPSVQVMDDDGKSASAAEIIAARQKAAQDVKKSDDSAGEEKSQIQDLMSQLEDDDDDDEIAS